jgi:formate/nitrite transporter FocA (FNT family)
MGRELMTDDGWPMTDQKMENDNGIRQDPQQRELQEKAKEAKGSKSYSDIISTLLHEGESMFDLQNKTIFLSAIVAGLEIGFSYLLVCAVYYLWKGTFSNTVIFHLFYGIVYPVGFILAIIGKSALYTEQTSILVLPVLNEQRSIWQLIRVWFDVIVGNIIGGIIFVSFISYLAPQLHLFTHETMAAVGDHALNYNDATLFLSAITAGWLMGLLTWLMSTTINSITRFVTVYMITAIIGFGGFLHSIVGSLEAFGGLLFSPAISFPVYVKFLVLALIGNGVGGGIVVALFKYQVFRSNFIEE